MDLDHEMKRFNWLLGLGLGWLIATFFAWGELKYAVAGRAATAMTGKTEVVYASSRRGRNTSYPVVNYTFTDHAGHARTGYDRVPDDYAAAPGQAIAVTYRGTEADGPSRLAGTRWGVLAVWLAFFAPTAWFVGGMIRESAAYAREKKARAANAKKPYRF